MKFDPPCCMVLPGRLQLTKRHKVQIADIIFSSGAQLSTSRYCIWEGKSGQEQLQVVKGLAQGLVARRRDFMD